jgi:hypothetical protein
MPIKLNLPDIPETERTPLVDTLLGVIEQLVQENSGQAETIQQLRDEIAILKGEKGKPKFKPSGMEEKAGTHSDGDRDNNGDDACDNNKKRPGSQKRGKKKKLTVHESRIVAPHEEIPDGSVFKGYDDFIVQEIYFEAHNIRYRREIWLTPEGTWLRGKLPDYQKGQSFGPTLRQFILYQHHHCQVTQPLIYEQLREIGVDISTGQIDALLTKRAKSFIEEKNDILRIGLQYSDHINVDDSGARHQGHNGYVTHIGNQAFACFSTTYSKSRINFLELLHAGTPQYAYNEFALDYFRSQGLPKEPLSKLQAQDIMQDTSEWEAHLDTLEIKDERHRRIATEGALLGGLIECGFNTELVIVSDGAGQFAILLHALCWVHAERLVHKLIPLNDQHREDIAKVRSEIWTLYADLKCFRDNPTPSAATELEARFDTIFTQKTRFETFNQLLKRLHKRKKELLLVLERPEIPLHNNLSEGDIREHVKKRKISGGTRSDLGRRCRDAFSSLKKTCRKHGLSFWDYLGDRIRSEGDIPPLPDLVRNRLLTMSY